MANFVLNDRVEVRGAAAHLFRAGVVSDANAGPGGGCYKVTLDVAVDADAWGGRTRKYHGANTLSVVAIFKNAEVLDPGVYIKAEGS